MPREKKTKRRVRGKAKLKQKQKQRQHQVVHNTITIHAEKKKRARAPRKARATSDARPMHAPSSYTSVNVVQRLPTIEHSSSDYSRELVRPEPPRDVAAPQPVQNQEGPGPDVVEMRAQLAAAREGLDQINQIQAENRRRAEERARAADERRANEQQAYAEALHRQRNAGVVQDINFIGDVARHNEFMDEGNAQLRRMEEHLQAEREAHGRALARRDDLVNQMDALDEEEAPAAQGMPQEAVSEDEPKPARRDINRRPPWIPSGISPPRRGGQTSNRIRRRPGDLSSPVARARYESAIDRVAMLDIHHMELSPLVTAARAIGISVSRANEKNKNWLVNAISRTIAAYR